MAINNTVTYNRHDYVQKLRNRINAPSSWKDILNVKVRDTRTIVEGYLSDEGALQTGTRGTAYGYDTFTIAQDTLTISTKKIIPLFVDEADRAQQTYADKMKIAEVQGKLVDEYLETQTLAQHASFTDFGLTDLSNTGDDDTSQITVSATNIDDLIRAMKRKLNANDGVDFMAEKGVFTVWRPEDWEILEAFAQANGYTIADLALKNGIPGEKAFYYMGMYHYLSNSHTANHLMAGVRKQFELGILRHTYGKTKFIEDPGLTSGLGIVTRIDHGFNMSAYLKEFAIDVNVA